MSENAVAEIVESQERGMQQITPMQLLNLAMDKGADIERMEKLMEMHMRWEANEARKAFHEARAAFAQEDIKISKDGRVHFKSNKGTTDYRHETLGHVLEQVSRPMSKHGLSHSWDVRQEGTRIIVTCRLSHELGHSETVTMEGLADQSGNKNSIQQLGSTVSYLQRYTLKAILGLASVDDDGQQAPPAKEASQQAPANGYMPDERFEQVFPAWKKMLVWGEKGVDDILKAAQNKGIKLSPQQIQRIKEVKNETA